MSNLTFLKNLNESKLFSNGWFSLSNYDIKDISNLLFVHILAIQILKYESNKEVVRYLGDLFNFNFEHWNNANNEIQAFLHLLVGKNSKKAQSYLKNFEYNQRYFATIRINESDLRKYFRLVQFGVSDEVFERRFLLEMQSGLRITDIRLQSIRRYVSTWKLQNNNAKKSTLNSLLQVFREKSEKSGLFTLLNTISHY